MDVVRLAPCLLLFGLVAPARAGEPAAPDYATDIQPILAAHCTKCHGDRKQESGLRLDAAAGWKVGGYSGPAVEPGNAEESLMIQAVRGTGDVSRMPPEGPPLPDEQVALLRAWISAGAPAPAEPTSTTSTRRTSDHWAFQPVADPPLPGIANTDWIRNEIDRFVLARLEAEGVDPSPEADRTTLIRRLYLDLLGLPPAPAEVDVFVADDDPNAYDRLVDRLLASAHYGERWGRHWLDLARYADSNGYTIDSARQIWKYRDWVIAALNADMPFDRFVIEQIAGDMLPEASVEQKIATGFHRNTLVNEEGGTDKEQFRVEAVVDRVSTTGTVFLGLSIGCARCHDHKYDPISQRDFYEMFALLNNADEPVLSMPTDEQTRQQQALRAELAAARKALAEREQALAAEQQRLESEDADHFASLFAAVELPNSTRKALATPTGERSESQRQAVAAAFHALHEDFPPLTEKVKNLEASVRAFNDKIVSTLVMQELPKPRTTHIHIRGDFLRHGVQVAGGVPEVLPPLDTGDASPTRLDLARWLVRPDNPLTPRVTVNRIWQQLFGRGLVETENDFGLQGTGPSHPELLDWLARRFVADGWSLKQLQRRIVTSAAYRQASAARPDLNQIDPSNILLARQRRLRLEAEAIRDASLAASGLLCATVGGPSVYPPVAPGAMAVTQNKKAWPESQGADRFRRGMYTFFWRSAPHPFLTLFDAPDANAACTRRDRSSTPLQALTLLNDAASFEAAQALALRTLAELPHADDQARLIHAFRLCLARPPSTTELKHLAAHLNLERTEPADPGAPPAAALADRVGPDVGPLELAAWTSVARVLLNLDEFITRE